MKALALIAVAMAMTSAATSAEVRPASETEIADALVGCWLREEPAGSRFTEEICFGPADHLQKTWVRRSDGHPEKQAATFRVVDGKLQFIGGAEPEWNMVSSLQSCDVLMRVEVAMRLDNCTLTRDHGSEMISEPFNGSVSYAKVKE